jgi:hypothetical protein
MDGEICILWCIIYEAGILRINVAWNVKGKQYHCETLTPYSIEKITGTTNFMCHSVEWIQHNSLKFV